MNYRIKVLHNGNNRIVAEQHSWFDVLPRIVFRCCGVSVGWFFWGVDFYHTDDYSVGNIALNR